MSAQTILPQVEELLSTLKDLMPTIYQKETFLSIIGLFLDGQGNAIPHHCHTKSESAISRFLNHYNWEHPIFAEIKHYSRKIIAK
jgi:hypothetical protein